MSVVPTVSIRLRHGYRTVKNFFGKERRIYDSVVTLQQKFEVNGNPEWRNIAIVVEENQK